MQNGEEGLPRPFYYIREEDGTVHPIDDVLEWADRMAAIKDRWSLRTTVEEGVEVSTVFLAMDHSYLTYGGHAPLLFETMVFGGPLDGEMERYATEEAAYVGHGAMIERVREATEEE